VSQKTLTVNFWQSYLKIKRWTFFGTECRLLIVVYHVCLVNNNSHNFVVRHWHGAYPFTALSFACMSSGGRCDTLDVDDVVWTTNNAISSRVDARLSVDDCQLHAVHTQRLSLLEYFNCLHAVTSRPRPPTIALFINNFCANSSSHVCSQFLIQIDNSHTSFYKITSTRRSFG